MKLVKIVLATSLLWSTIANSAVQFVFDVELIPGSALSNNTIATAQETFTLSTDNTYEFIGGKGVDDVDFYKVIIGSATTLSLNLTLDAPGGFYYTNDPILGVFNNAGSLIAYNDDGGTGYNAAINDLVLGAGTYYFAVSQYLDSGFVGIGNDSFSYRLAAITSTASAVPEPESGALVLAGLGLIGLISRRKFK